MVSIFFRRTPLQASPKPATACLSSITTGYAPQPLRTVVVQAQVGKEFPDMRQKRREIKFIRVGDAVRRVGQLKREPTWNRGP